MLLANAGIDGLALFSKVILTKHELLLHNKEINDLQELMFRQLGCIHTHRLRPREHHHFTLYQGTNLYTLKSHSTCMMYIQLTSTY